MVAERVKPVLKYPGSKFLAAPWIVQQFPAHRMYCEPFFGSGAVFFTMQPAEYEVINDRNASVVNLFRVIRERGADLTAAIELTPWARDEYEASYHATGDSFEDARRFLVRCWQAHGTRLSHRTGWRNRGSADGGATTALWNQLPERILALVSRLKHAEIESRPALEVITRYADDSDCLIYADPPYTLDTRGGRKLYEDEMTDADHVALLDALEQHSGPVVLSGYANHLYDERLKHWQRVELPTLAEKGQVRLEVLWLNARAGRNQQRSLFEAL